MKVAVRTTDNQVQVYEGDLVDRLVNELGVTDTLTQLKQEITGAAVVLLRIK